MSGCPFGITINRLGNIKYDVDVCTVEWVLMFVLMLFHYIEDVIIEDDGL